jgi:hypothetical protein
MDEQELQDGLKLMLDDALAVALGDLDPEDIEMPEAFEELTRVATYDEVGMLTTDKGLVLRFKDGSEWQVSIVRSR